MEHFAFSYSYSNIGLESSSSLSDFVRCPCTHFLIPYSRNAHSYSNQTPGEGISGRVKPGEARTQRAGGDPWRAWRVATSGRRAYVEESSDVCLFPLRSCRDGLVQCTHWLLFLLFLNEEQVNQVNWGVASNPVGVCSVHDKASCRGSFAGGQGWHMIWNRAVGVQ